ARAGGNAFNSSTDAARIEMEEAMSHGSISTPARSPKAALLPVAREPASQTLSRGEVLMAAALALAGYSALLVRMPYRAPLANGLYAGIALSSFYFYLRWRINIRIPLAVLS